MNQSVRLTLVAGILAVCFLCCTDSRVNTDSAVGPTSTGLEKKPTPPPPGNANPAIAYSRSYAVNNRFSVPAIYVMDADGANQTMVYANYIYQGNTHSYQTPDFPTWSPDGQKLCFNLNGSDLYTLTISLVNGYPVGSNPNKICDGVADGGNYRKGVWSTTTNEIATVWQHSPDPTQIQIVPSTGGTPATLYTSPSTDFTVSDYLTYNPDGSKIAFTERQQSTGNNFLNIIERSSGTIIQSIDLSQFYQFTGLDWSRTLGSNIIAFSVLPTEPCAPNPDAHHKIYTIDVGTTAEPVLQVNYCSSVTWSPDDSKVAFCAFSWSVGGGCGEIRHYRGIWTYTFSSGVESYLESSGNEPDWKR